jgi:hypothetical protein
LKEPKKSARSEDVAVRIDGTGRSNERGPHRRRMVAVEIEDQAIQLLTSGVEQRAAA